MGKRKLNLIACLSVVIVCASTLFLPGSVWSAPVTFDWDDGKLQGWTPEPPFWGNLGVDSSFGNPNGSMFATDDRAGGGLLARAPSSLSGDLSIYDGIRWDEFVPDPGSSTLSTFVLIRSSDGTMYSGTQNVGVRGSWNSRFEPFDDPTAWTLYLGNDSTSFLDAIQDVEALFISMDTYGLSGGRLESYVDNVSTVPIPSTLFLLCSGLICLFVRDIKRRK